MRNTLMMAFVVLLSNIASCEYHGNTDCPIPEGRYEIIRAVDTDLLGEIVDIAEDRIIIEYTRENGTVWEVVYRRTGEIEEEE